ncbi:granzyme E-like isoform X2 [Girardinichthys multiradiatus]|uniref:granzyme E-like isoform X2 n=1 Tax=Girardinichthys multiradiatus TaxID=208333 RepID=UPI001FAD109D|nr:granzyme E-like isoform X2 [Girardinichthys multiradiatus]
MFIYYILSALVLVLTFHSQAHAGKIIGGHKAVAHSRPYMALVECYGANGKKNHCGGFLVSEEFVMTAAHCKAESYKVCVGMDYYSDKDKLCLPVKHDFPHGKYNKTTFTNDVMLLKLSTRVIFNKNVKPIRLADMNDPVPKTCLVSGWGATSNDNNNNWMSDKLMEVNVTLIDNDLCDEKIVYCSAGEKRPGQGDSGGPLVCEDGKAYGVISAKAHGLQLYKYTKIPDKMEWIDELMKLN